MFLNFHALHTEKIKVKKDKIIVRSEVWSLSCSFLYRQQGAAECKTDVPVGVELDRAWSFLKSDPLSSVSLAKLTLLCTLFINHLRRTDVVCVVQSVDGA